MANYILCRKHFISLGKCEIEMGDININTVSVQSNNRKIDRTSFLKHGLAYDTLQSETSFRYLSIQCNIMINQDDNGMYFKNTVISDNLFVVKPLDKIIFGDTEIYSIVTSISSDGKFYIDYYTKLPSIDTLTYKKIQIVKYNDIKEYTKTYDIKIDSNNTENLVPIFLPEMTENLSATKTILIHINNNLSDMSFIFLTHKGYLNTLTKTIPFVLKYNKTKDNQGYRTFIVNFLYNGETWFSI